MEKRHNCCEERTEDEHKQSKAACVQRAVCPLPTARAVLVLESRTGYSGFRITKPTVNREPFLSDTSDLGADDLMILHMRVIFQADEKHVIQVLLIIRKCDNIKHYNFFLKMNVSNLCILFS